jgi:phosphoribosylformylglycinamidine cyclo-ligase
LGTTLGDELIKPTKLYVKTILDLKGKYEIKGISHITGGGFIENIPRMIPEGLRVKIKKGTWPVLPIFNLLQQLGEIKETDIYNTFNMGIGMVLAVDSSIADEIVKYLNNDNEQAYLIGEVVNGEAGVDIC